MELPGESKRLAVCLYIQGTTPERGFRILDELEKTKGLGTTWDLLVGIDTPRYDLALYTSQEHLTRRRIVWFESSFELGQITWWQALLANIRSRFVLLLNDRITVSPNWLESVCRYIDTTPPPDACAFSDNPQDHAHVSTTALLMRTAWYRESSTTLLSESTPCRLPTNDIKSAARLGFELPSHSSLFEPSLILQPQYTESSAPVGQRPVLASACLCTYGDHVELVTRCVDSILREPGSSGAIELLIGCNNSSAKVISELERRSQERPFGVFIRSPYNFNKSGMQRFTFRLARASYILSLDDDMYFEPGWLPPLQHCIASQQPFEVAGRLHSLTNRAWWSGKKRPYDQFVRRKKWWRNKTPHGAEVHFPAGQCFLARKAFMLQNDYPDLDMRIDWDDVLLGDMVTQLDAKQIFFPAELSRRIIVEEIDSRGQHGGG